jgi:hypothetical protein
MKTRTGPRVGRRHPTLFDQQAPALAATNGRETVSAIVDALAELLLQAAGASQRARGAGGEHDELEDHR